MSISSVLQSMQGPRVTSVVVESEIARRTSISSVGLLIICSETEMDSSAASTMETASSESSIL